MKTGEKKSENIVTKVTTTTTTTTLQVAMKKPKKDKSKAEKLALVKEDGATKRCQAKKKDGAQCTNAIAAGNKKYCNVHSA